MASYNEIEGAGAKQEVPTVGFISWGEWYFTIEDNGDTIYHCPFFFQKGETMGKLLTYHTKDREEAEYMYQTGNLPEDELTAIFEYPCDPLYTEDETQQNVVVEDDNEIQNQNETEFQLNADETRQGQYDENKNEFELNADETHQGQYDENRTEFELNADETHQGEYDVEENGHESNDFPDMRINGPQGNNRNKFGLFLTLAIIFTIGFVFLVCLPSYIRHIHQCKLAMEEFQECQLIRSNKLALHKLNYANYNTYNGAVAFMEENLLFGRVGLDFLKFQIPDPMIPECTLVIPEYQVSYYWLF